jgi:hypothetical protein
VGVFVLLAWRRPLLSRRYAWVYGSMAIIYAAIQARYGNTLPFLHPITCRNHPPGCHPEWYYYLGILQKFLTGGDLDFVPGALVPSLPAAAANLFLPVVLLAIGLTATAVTIRRGGERRAGYVLVVAWFLLPLILLSVPEVKFPRYLVYVMPPMFLLLAHGLVTITSAAAPRRLRAGVLAVLAVVVLLAPQLHEEAVGGERTTRLQSRFVAHARDKSLDGDADNWERMGDQVAFLRQHLGEKDLVVTSLDDASLGYYLRRFVYGFLNSEHDDAFFLRLLARASKDGGRLWFVDTLPAHNYCHTRGDDPRSIDCRLKYRRFYEACRPDSPTFNPTCVRLRFD